MGQTFTVEIPGAAMSFLSGSGPVQQWEEPEWAELNGPVATSIGRKLAEAPSRKVGFGRVYTLFGTRKELEYLADMCAAGVETYEYGDGPKSEADACRKVIARIHGLLA
jgi:hypothetical protein